jgi:hypothetical protein
MPLHGAAAVLLDDQLAGVLLEMYTQHDHDGDYQTRVLPIPGPAADDFAAWTVNVIASDPGPWNAFSAAAARAVRARERDLALILERTEARVSDPEASHETLDVTAPATPTAPSSSQ